MVNEISSIKPTITCSWAPEISNLILSVGDKNDPSQWDSDGAIIHMIAEDNFVNLKRPTEDEEPCTIHIKINEPLMQITNISLVSEAHIFEIYGKHGEYIKTCRSDYFAQEKEIEIYVGQPSLLTTHEVSIKFPGSSKEFWLCGIKLMLQKITSPLSTFDYSLIDEKLRSSNIPITEKAEKFKKFLQEYNAANKCTPKNMDPQMLLKFLEGECLAHLKPVSESSKNMTNYLSNLLPSLLKDSSNEQDSGNAPSGSEPSSSSTLKNYVDESLQKLEEKIQRNFEKQLGELEAKQNEKLDAILNLLQNSALR